MRQPVQLDPAEAATKPQRGKVGQIADLDEMERLQFGEASQEMPA
jgi:hypothetical protein